MFDKTQDALVPPGELNSLRRTRTRPAEMGYAAEGRVTSEREERRVSVKGTIIILVLVSATLLVALFLLRSDPLGIDVDPNTPAQSISEAPG
jgi:hypothetical protein